MEHGVSVLREGVVLLGAGLVFVMLFRRFGLGAVLGYLVAGVVIGPFGLGLVAGGESKLGIAEIGIVLLLFIVGLELSPARLWRLKRDIFGLGLAQVLMCGLTLAAVILYASGFTWGAAIALGLPLALSSTAQVLPSLKSSGRINTPFGERAFSVLLFQDLSIVPLITVIAALSRAPVDPAMPPGWLLGVYTVGAIIVLVLAGRFIISPALRLTGQLGERELFVVVGLFTVFASVNASVPAPRSNVPEVTAEAIVSASLPAPRSTAAAPNEPPRLTVSAPESPMTVSTLDRVMSLVPLNRVTLSLPAFRLTVTPVAAAPKVRVSTPVPPVMDSILATVPVLTKLPKTRLSAPAPRSINVLLRSVSWLLMVMVSAPVPPMMVSMFPGRVRSLLPPEIVIVVMGGLLGMVTMCWQAACAQDPYGPGRNNAASLHINGNLSGNLSCIACRPLNRCLAPVLPAEPGAAGSAMAVENCP